MPDLPGKRVSGERAAFQLCGQLSGGYGPVYFQVCDPAGPGKAPRGDPERVYPVSAEK